MTSPEPFRRALFLTAIASVLPGCAGFDLNAWLPRTAAAADTTPPPSGPSHVASPASVAAESRASRAHLDAATSARGANMLAAVPNARLRGARRAACGARGQRPCYVWEALPSCDAGLVENLLAHRCETTGRDGALLTNARAVARDATDLLVTLGGYLTCFDAKLLEGAVRRGDAAYAEKIRRSSCVQRMGAVAAARGYRTLTVGVSGGGSFVVGGFVDTGFAFDTAGERGPTLYQTKALSIGFQAGGGVGVNIGLSKGSQRVDPRGSDLQGFALEAGAGAGAGTGIWYDYDGRLDGMSVSAIAGASGKAGAYNRLTTSYYDLKGQNPVTCGGSGQRACKVWERIPSCNRGLAEDLRRGTCERPQKFRCGAAGQRPCKLWERVPSCNPGLREHFLRGQCVR
ncbi:MAG: hypothetical protein AAF928_19555 [Myxococcota bacterium]